MSQRSGRIGTILLFALLLCCSLASGISYALPAGSAYEMVSPAYKGGYGVAQIGAVGQNGEDLTFFSKGVFAEAPSGPTPVDYVARRHVTGWSTAPLMPPASLMPFVSSQDVSASLSTSLVLGKPGLNEEGAFAGGTQEEFLIHNLGEPDLGASWQLTGPVVENMAKKPVVLGYEGASADFCTVIFSARVPLLPEVTTDTKQLYEVSTCAGQGEAKTVGLDNKKEVIDEECGVEPGGQEGGNGSTFNAVADGGSEIFFTTNVEASKSRNCFFGQLFMRIDGRRTVEISRKLENGKFNGCIAKGVPGEVPCEGSETRASAKFEGASEDGSKVFFTTTAPLSGSDHDTENDIYMARIGCPRAVSVCDPSEDEVTSLSQISLGQNQGEAARVQGVVKISQDGSHVLFVAAGDLLNSTETNTLEAAGLSVPHPNADNLYIYDSVSEKLGFVADLCSGPGESGFKVADVHCPTSLSAGEGGRNDSGLWLAANNRPEAQTTSHGNAIIFSTYAQLVAGDTDTARDIYRYDSPSSRLARVSTGEDGESGNGNESGAVADASITPGYRGDAGVRTQYELGSRAVSDDGTRVVFETAEALSQQAVNGLVNVYEWHQQPGVNEGEVSLISSGTSEENVEDAVIAPEGEDVFFVTSQGLVPQDTDGANDVYDARENGGFPSLANPQQQCGSDACGGPLSNPTPLLVPGSAAQASGENVAPIAVSKKKPKQKIKKQKRKTKKKKPKRKVGSRATLRSAGRGRKGI